MEWRRHRVGDLDDGNAPVHRHLLPVGAALVGTAAVFVAIGFAALAVPIGVFLVVLVSFVVAADRRERSVGSSGRAAAREEEAVRVSVDRAADKGWVHRSAIPMRGGPLHHVLIGDERVVLIELVNTDTPWAVVGGRVEIDGVDVLPSVQERSRMAKHLAAGADRTVTRDVWLVVSGPRGTWPTPNQVREVLVARPDNLSAVVAALPPVVNRVRRDQWVARVDGYLSRGTPTRATAASDAGSRRRALRGPARGSTLEPR